MCDDILRQAVEGISEIITTPGIINVDFADVRAIMQDAGSALMGVGLASGEERAIEAARQAVESPLLDLSIEGAKGVLFTITGSPTFIWKLAKSISKALELISSVVTSPFTLTS